jgi:endonuclease YncB( thermonuclease family)
MKRFRAACALAMAVSTGAALGATVPNTRTGPQVVVKRARACASADILVIDGDTISCRGKHIRLLGLDTPELHTYCEHGIAVAAKTRLQELLAPPHRVLIRENRKLDKYGRTLAVVLSDGKDVAPVLIGEGLAHPYSGGTRGGWC